MSNIVNGFAKGVGLMDSLLNVSKREKQQEKAEARAEEMMDMRRENHSLGLQDFQDRRNQRTRQAELSEAAAERSETVFEQGQQDRVMKLLAQQAAAIENSGVKLSEDDFDYLSANSGINAEYLLSDEVGQSLDVAEGLFSGQHSMQSPEVAKAATVLFPETINKSQSKVGGVAALYPGQQEGTVMIELDTENGLRPMSENRSSEPGDRVKQIPVKSLTNKIQGIRQLRGMLESPEGRKYLMEMGGLGGKKAAGQVTYGKLQMDEATGNYGQYDSSGKFHVVKSSKPGADGEPQSATGKTIKDLMRVGVPKDEAIKLATQSKKDPAGAAVNFAKTILSTQDEFAEDKLTPEQAMVEAKRILGISEAEPKSKSKPKADQQSDSPGVEIPDSLKAQFETMRANPNNDKFTDEQILRGLAGKLGGGQ